MASLVSTIAKNFTVNFIFGVSLTFFELTDAIACFLLQFFVQVSNFFIFGFEPFICIFGQGIDIPLKVFSGLFELKLELMLEGQESVIGPFGLVRYVLFTALDFSNLDGRVPFDILETGIQLFLPLFPTLLHIVEILIHLGKLLFEELRTLLILLDRRHGDYLKINTVDSNSEGYFKYIYGIYYTKNKLYNNANSKFREAILLLESSNNEEIDLTLISKVYLQLSISLAKSGKSTEAYLALLEHNSYKNKLLNQKKTKQDLITKSKFLIEDYRNNAKVANAERLQQLEITNKFKKINIAIKSMLIWLNTIK